MMPELAWIVVAILFIALLVIGGMLLYVMGQTHSLEHMMGVMAARLSRQQPEDDADE